MFIGNRFLYVSVAVVAAVLIFWVGDPRPALTQDIHLGDWTCESGPPGNQLSFWLEEVPMPYSPFVRGFEGRVRVKNLLDREAEDGTWGYATCRPLRLNVTVGQDSLVVAVRRVDPEHLLVRFAPDYREFMAGNPFDHPDVLRLRRAPD